VGRHVYTEKVEYVTGTRRLPAASKNVMMGHDEAREPPKVSILLSNVMVISRDLPQMEIA
jgi:hypothetical protein